MKNEMKWVMGVGTALVLGVAGFFAGRAWAVGIPASGALTYSGLLQDANGIPLSGPQYVEVKFWNHATAIDAVNNLVCDSGTPASVSLQLGHFFLGLPDTCTTGIGANKDVWAEVFVGASAASAVSLGRLKIGTVPYAVEANHAVSADNATNATTAKNATLSASATAMVNTSIRRVSEGECTYSGGYTDCVCGDNEIAMGGGACTGKLCDAAGSSIVETSQVKPNTWRISCENSVGERQPCNGTHAICMKVM